MNREKFNNLISSLRNSSLDEASYADLVFCGLFWLFCLKYAMPQAINTGINLLNNLEKGDLTA